MCRPFICSPALQTKHWDVGLENMIQPQSMVLAPVKFFTQSLALSHMAMYHIMAFPSVTDHVYNSLRLYHLVIPYKPTWWYSCYIMMKLPNYAFLKICLHHQGLHDYVPCQIPMYGWFLDVFWLTYYYLSRIMGFIALLFACLLLLLLFLKQGLALEAQT